MKLRTLIALGGAAAAVLGGCGNSRTPVPSLAQPVAPGSLRLVNYRNAGLSIREPTNWLISRGAPPLVTTISLSSAVAALWRYPRHDPVPAAGTPLTQARLQLIAAARRRDPSLQLIRSSVAMIDGFPAVEVDAFERVGNQLRRVRSTHVFTPDAEVVLDEYAPPPLFHRVDHAVFSPLKRSLRVSGVPPA